MINGLPSDRASASRSDPTNGNTAAAALTWADAHATAVEWQSLRGEVEATLECLRTLDAGEEAGIAAVLHVALQCGVPVADVEAEPWPAAVRPLLEGQQAAEKVWSLHAAQDPAASSEGLRRLLLAIVRDLRVVLVLLARQLVRMRAVVRAPEAEQRALARLTADIHAPLANRLGIWQFKWELEDLAFRYLQPDTYQRIARLLDERRSDRERWIADARAELGAALAAGGIAADVAGRPKHIHSIWRKMQKKGREFSELYDVRALRVMVDDVTACYAALGVVHALWTPIPGEFDDYIASPKGNRYQSLHTAVVGPGGLALEVQIRTPEMHRQAELGVAAHWRYKEGGTGDAEFERRIAWMRQLLESREGREDEAALLAGFRTEVALDRVYVLTPKGQVIDLPQGATVVDFAYAIHTDVGHRCRGARVDGRIVPLTHRPVSGDRVEILTGKTPEPRRDWLSEQSGVLTTHRAREKVRAWFKRIDHAQNLAAGRAILDRELKRLALPPANLDALPERFRVRGHEALLEALALGDVTPGHLARALHEIAAPAPAAETPTVKALAPRDKAGDGADRFAIEGIGNLLTQLAQCCRPVPGDAIAGYITRGRGISVHRATCAQLARLAAQDADRMVQVTWGSTRRRAYEVALAVRGYDRKGLHKDLHAVIAAADAPIVAADTRADARRGILEARIVVKVADFGQLSALIDALLAVPNVTDVRRVG